MNCIEKGDVQSWESIEKLKRAYNYKENENKVICFLHNVKDHAQIEIFAEWFDLNITDKVTWLIYKKVSEECYKNVKLDNINPRVKILQKRCSNYESIY